MLVPVAVVNCGRCGGKPPFLTCQYAGRANGVPMAASLATLKIARRDGVVERIHRLGEKLRAGIAAQAKSIGICVRQTGPAQMPMILFDDDPERARGNFWVSESVKRGVYLHPWHNMFLCAAHTKADIDRTLEVTEEAFAALSRSGP